MPAGDDNVIFNQISPGLRFRRRASRDFMSLLPLSRPAIRTALTLLASAVLSLVCSSRVQATCSQHVHSTGQLGFESTLSSLRLHDLDPAMPLRSTTPTEQHGPGNELPCSGPGCSNRSFPTEAPSSVRVERSSDWCLGTLAPELVDQGSSHLVHPSGIDLPIRYPASIERPPRGR